jgi:hypothetical protein
MVFITCSQHILFNSRYYLTSLLYSLVERVFDPCLIIYYASHYPLVDFVVMLGF